MTDFCQTNISETIESKSLDCSHCTVLYDAIESLHQASMEQSKDDFLKTALYHFQRLLKADFVFAGHLHENGSQAIQTNLILHKGMVVPNMEYMLEGTPCENVVSRNACIYPSEITKQFPEDIFFQDNNIESYVGAPIIDQYYNMYGILVAMSVKPIIDSYLTLHLSKLFAMATSQFIATRS